MKCNKCANATTVVDSRQDGNVIRRKRVCGTCLNRMNTVEKLDELVETPINNFNKKQETKTK